MAPSLFLNDRGTNRFRATAFLLRGCIFLLIWYDIPSDFLNKIFEIWWNLNVICHLNILVNVFFQLLEYPSHFHINTMLFACDTRSCQIFFQVFFGPKLGRIRVEISFIIECSPFGACFPLNALFFSFDSSRCGCPLLSRTYSSREPYSA